MTLLASERSMLIRSKFRSVLQLRMQNRRTQEQRAENAIMPALEKAQPTFSEPPNGLDRCRIEELGKHKDHNRPMQTDVGKAHLPEESNVEVTELKQKKARLTEDLSDRILHQPGPLELLEKNILPLDSSIKDAMKGQIPFPETSESFPFDDDLSSTASSSPEQPGHEQSRCFATSPGITNDESSSTSSTNFQCHFQLPQGMEINQSIVASVSEAESLTINGQATNGISTTKAPILPKAPLKPSEAAKSQRHKKPKDSRPKVKKLKYHQYVPPDQKAEKVPATMDTAYSQLLQQQQIFLQQQIINQQQKQAFCLQAVFPINTSDHIISFTSAAPTCAPAIPLSSPTTPSTPSTPSPSKPELLPANLDDLTDLANSSATETGLPTFLGSDSGAIRQDSNLEVFCPSVGEDFDLPMQITASPTNNTSGSSRSLEEELRDAIKRVQMAPSQSIDDILEDHIVCTDGTAQSDIIFLEPQTEDHLVSSTDFTSSFPNSTHLSSFSQELASLKPRNGDSQPMVLEFPGTSQYDLLGGSFSPACIEMPPSPENQDKRVDQKKTTFDPADWLEALTSGSASGFGPGSPVSQSIFSTDFFDSPDLNINRMIELIIEQW